MVEINDSASCSLANPSSLVSCIASTRTNDWRSRYNHTTNNVRDEGTKPIGPVTVGKLRNPPPIVVPEISKAEFKIVENDGLFVVADSFV